MDILEKQEYRMRNVLAYRAKLSQLQIKEKGQELDKYIKGTGAVSTGLPVTATYAIENSSGGPKIDMELLIPLDRDISKEVSEGVKQNTLDKGVRFLPEFILTNAVKIKHKGNPSRIQESLNVLNEYIAEKKLVPITVGYNVTVKQPKSMAEIDEMEIDTYVGINPNRI